MPAAKLPFMRIKPSKAMLGASSYDEWLQAAREQDEQKGLLAWRKSDDSRLLDGPLMRDHIKQFGELTAAGNIAELAALLHESLYRHQGDIANPHLYEMAFSGTKYVIDDYLAAVDSALNTITDSQSTELSAAAKLTLLQDAGHNMGQSALLLSGGASMGFFHLGVTKAMHSQRLLPTTICGASMGSLIGGGICTRSDEELDDLFADLNGIYRFGIRFLKPLEIVKHKLLLDQEQLALCAIENMGEMTFAEAEAHTGRQFCISVSPSRARQKPRVLSAKTSPDILVANAVTASCAIPGVYPPVSLQSRSAGGSPKPYLPGEKWVDGTFQGDLPMKRLGRLFNINHFIVSQVNPHAIPFLVSRHARGPAALAADLILSSAQKQTAQTLKVLQQRIANPRLHNVMEHGRLLAEQEYKGDINIHPQLSPWLYRKMLSNPSIEDLQRYISMGERATWPKISLIRNQTQVQTTLANCVRRLQT